MRLSDTARFVYDNRYRVDDECPEDMLRRVAHTLVEVEKMRGWLNSYSGPTIEHEFFKTMDEQLALPNSPTLFNAGRDSGQLSACFVLPINDSLSSIYRTLHDAVVIQHTGGGCGYSFSALRPNRSSVLSSRGLAGGPVCFLKVYDAGLMPIKQGGRRPGANMATLSASHPDIHEFIACKNEEGVITNFNISVEVSDAFISAVHKDLMWDLIDPHTNTMALTVRAQDLLRNIAEYAWKNGEPGVIFLERMNAENPTPLSPYPSVNPCGEQPLPAYEACNLGSINLANHINDKCDDFDWAKLMRTVELMVRMLDDVVEAGKFPIEEVTQNVAKHRRIGLGVMGWADALIKMNLPYCSKDSTKRAADVMSFITRHARKASVVLARIRGSFPGFAQSRIKELHGYDRMRNATVTTIAPTGSISMLADCSSGIEPVYAFEYERFVRTPTGDKPMTVRHPMYEQALRKERPYSPEVFVGTEDISWEWHLMHQAAFQAFCDNGVSKTINMRYDASVDDIYNAILLAHELGLKGFTVYRTGSREVQVLDSRKDCPSCGNKTVVNVEHCMKCSSCGWSQCSLPNTPPSVFSSGVIDYAVSSP